MIRVCTNDEREWDRKRERKAHIQEIWQSRKCQNWWLLGYKEGGKRMNQSQLSSSQPGSQNGGAINRSDTMDRVGVCAYTHPYYLVRRFIKSSGYWRDSEGGEQGPCCIDQMDREGSFLEPAPNSRGRLCTSRTRALSQAGASFLQVGQPTPGLCGGGANPWGRLDSASSAYLR